MKKTLPVLLLAPFAVAILTFVSITPIRNLIAVDIDGISWDYLDSEGFKVGESYELEATPIYDENFTLADGNDLVWTSADEEVAAIKRSGDAFYLDAIQEGSCRITCSNEKGSVSRNFLATVYEDGAITIVDAGTPASGDSFEDVRTYGQYDYSYEGGTATKVQAAITLSFGIYSDYDDDEVVLKEASSNLSYADSTLTVKAPGASYATFALQKMPFVTATYSFDVLEGAVNVKSYDDLMQATNLSEEGERICLQRNLLSLKSTYKSNGDGGYVDEYLNANTRLFGRYDFGRGTTSFDIYAFDTTYPHDYLDDYFAHNPPTPGQEDYLKVRTGIHVQKDFIGNGFAISCQELCYTYHGGYLGNGRWSPSSDGSNVSDYFEGPLPFVFLGPYDLQVITAYGQDNSAMYVEGNDIEISDLKLMAVDNVDDLNLLEYVGSTMDVLGANVTVSDTYLRNGRTALRVYSSPNFLLDNCYLNSAREFLLKVGSNEVSRPDPSTRVDASYGGALAHGTLEENFASGGGADQILDAVVRSGADIASAMEAMNAIQSSLDASEPLDAWDMTVRDTYFETSGLFSIAFESVFNGGYLYSGVPSFVSELLDTFMGMMNLKSVPPDQIGGVSRPVNMTIEGDTRFYDYKDISSIDASCLIYEQISAILAGVGSDSGDLTFPIDSYFPIKNLLQTAAERVGSNYRNEDGNFVLGAIAFYGGGLNLSAVDVSGMDVSPLGEELSVDYATACLSGIGLAEGNELSAYLARCVPLAAGTNPFRFVLSGDLRQVEKPYLFGEVADINALKARGGN